MVLIENAAICKAERTLAISLKLKDVSRHELNFIFEHNSVFILNNTYKFNNQQIKSAIVQSCSVISSAFFTSITTIKRTIYHVKGE